jgi:hypothetical protein
LRRLPLIRGVCPNVPNGTVRVTNHLISRDFRTHETLARRGELVALELRDIEWHWPGADPPGKTDSEGQGRAAYLSRETVKWLKVWLDHGNISEGPILLRLIGKRTFAPTRGARVK